MDIGRETAVWGIHQCFFPPIPPLFRAFDNTTLSLAAEGWAVFGLLIFVCRWHGRDKSSYIS